MARNFVLIRVLELLNPVGVDALHRRLHEHVSHCLLSVKNVITVLEHLFPIRHRMVTYVPMKEILVHGVSVVVGPVIRIFWSWSMRSFSYRYLGRLSPKGCGFRMRIASRIGTIR